MCCEKKEGGKGDKGWIPFLVYFRLTWMSGNFFFWMEIDHFIQFLTLTISKNKPKTETFLNTEKLVTNQPRRPLLMPSHLSNILHLTKAVSNPLLSPPRPSLHPQLHPARGRPKKSRFQKRPERPREPSARPDRRRRARPRR